MSDSRQKTIHPDFRRIFYRKEGKALMGHRFRNIWILALILFVTFSAIGFGNGSLAYLGEKMDDPFINWVSISVPYAKADIDKVKEKLNQPDVRERFNFRNVTGNFRYSLRFYNYTKEGTSSILGRTIEVDNPLLNEILNDDNLQAGRSFQDARDVGIIVTDGFLREFGYEADASHVLMAYPYRPDRDALIPLPIAAVIDELPGLNAFATTPYFHGQRNSKVAISPFNPDFTPDLLTFVLGDEKQAFAYQEAVARFFDEKMRKEYDQYDPYVAATPNVEDRGYRKGYILSISFLEKPSDDVLIDMFAALAADPDVAPFNPIRFFSQNFDDANENRDYDYLAVNFVNTAAVRGFKEYLKDEFDLDIDMAQIEAKENFNFVTNLTRIISVVLIGLSVLSICLFVTSIFRRHLDKIRRNIGTFKAFGLDNGTLMQTYLFLINIFIGIAMAVGLFSAWLFGSLGGIRLILWLTRNKIEPGQSYFELANIWTLIAIGAVLLISFVVLYLTANKILRRSPGDLIYDRD